MFQMSVFSRSPFTGLTIASTMPAEKVPAPPD